VRRLKEGVVENNFLPFSFFDETGRQSAIAGLNPEL
jgi:hypothetical protein